MSVAMSRLALVLVVAATAANVSAEATGTQADAQAVQLLVMKMALGKAERSRKVQVVYVSLGKQGNDPPTEVLAALADGTHLFKPASACPRESRGILGEFCRPEDGAVELFAGEVSFVKDDLADVSAGYSFDLLKAAGCPYRLRRAGDAWSLVADYVGACWVS